MCYALHYPLRNLFLFLQLQVDQIEAAAQPLLRMLVQVLYVYAGKRGLRGPGLSAVIAPALVAMHVVHTMATASLGSLLIYELAMQYL